ncbi:MAG: hypothetical protein JJU28_04400 [Cyclobacteriaceae bacterium]|nr:hypothetical protein [Cyclobacteriaceae bacterium]
MKFVFSLLLSLILTIGVYAQETQDQGNTKEKPRFWDRASFGGNFSFFSSREFTFIEFSPLLAYSLNQRFTVGGGPIYIYTKERYFFGGSPVSIRSNTYGGRSFVRADLAGPLFAYTELEAANTRFATIDNQTTERGWVPALYLGGGVLQPFGRRGGIGIMVLYDLLYDNRRSYNNSPVTYRMLFFF